MRTFTIARVAGSTLAQAIVPAAPNQTARVEYFHVTSDKAGSVLKLRVGKERHVTTAAAAASQAVINLESFTGLTDGDSLVVQPADGAAPYVVIISSHATLAVTLTANLAAALPAGSVVYRVVDFAQMPVGAASLERPSGGASGAALFTGQAERPIIAELDGTSACSINLLSGDLVNV